MPYTNIMRIIPTIHSAQLAADNAKALDKKKKSGDVVKMGMKNIVGIELIKAESGLIAGL